LIASDTITDVNLDEIVENHILSGAALTAVLKEDKISEETSKVINPSSLAVIQAERCVLIFSCRHFFFLYYSLLGRSRRVSVK